MNQANVNNGSGQYFKDEHVQAVDDFIAGRGPSAFYTTDNSITAAGQCLCWEHRLVRRNVQTVIHATA